MGVRRAGGESAKGEDFWGYCVLTRHGGVLTGISTNMAAVEPEDEEAIKRSRDAGWVELAGCDYDAHSRITEMIAGFCIRLARSLEEVEDYPKAQ